jgi:hypothetical protein
MILITYLKPYIVLSSNEIISGTFALYDKSGRLLVKESVENKNFISININSVDKDFIEAKFTSKGNEIKKKFILKNT